jgi:hypothetical protein
VLGCVACFEESPDPLQKGHHSTLLSALPLQQADKQNTHASDHMHVEA